MPHEANVSDFRTPDNYLGGKRDRGAKVYCGCATGTTFGGGVAIFSATRSITVIPPSNSCCADDTLCNSAVMRGSPPGIAALLSRHPSTSASRILLESRVR